MKTKTLLITAAAALAAGIMSSQAQVYSQNVVGYVNVPLTGGALTVVAPALDADGTGTNNTVGSVFTNNAAAGDVIYAFNGGGYDTLNYKAVGRGVPVAGWYLGSTLTNGYPLNPGRSVFYAAANNETNTQVGTVLQGTNLVNHAFATSAGGISLVSSVVPLGGGVDTVLQYNASAGDVIYQYNGAGYNTYNYKAVGRGVPTAGWYLGATLQEPQISVGTGFWLQPANSTNWVQNFIVQ